MLQFATMEIQRTVQIGPVLLPARKSVFVSFAAKFHILVHWSVDGRSTATDTGNWTSIQFPGFVLSTIKICVRAHHELLIVP
jgi:hypothetical protein